MIPAQIRNIIEYEVGTEWCVAGGFAANPVLADDIDVWVTGVDVEDHLVIARSLARDLALAYGPRFEEQMDMGSYLGDDFATLRVGKVNRKNIEQGLKDVHIIITNAGVQEMVNSFDVSTHACAITAEGRIVKAPEWTMPTLAPTRMRTTSTTEERMVKICKRFGWFYKEASVE